MSQQDFFEIKNGKKLSFYVHPCQDSKKLFDFLNEKSLENQLSIEKKDDGTIYGSAIIRKKYKREFIKRLKIIITSCGDQKFIKVDGLTTIRWTRDVMPEDPFMNVFTDHSDEPFYFGPPPAGNFDSQSHFASPPTGSFETQGNNSALLSPFPSNYLPNAAGTIPSIAFGASKNFPAALFPYGSFSYCDAHRNLCPLPKAPKRRNFNFNPPTPYSESDSDDSFVQYPPSRSRTPAQGPRSRGQKRVRFDLPEPEEETSEEGSSPGEEDFYEWFQEQKDKKNKK